MQEDLRVVFESSNRRSLADRALVLAAAKIPHQVIDDAATAALVVPAEYSTLAAKELQLYDDENPPIRPKPQRRVRYQDPVPGVIGYFLVVCAVAWLAGYGFFGHDWFDAGRVDGTLIRNGEWWRTITALTLHSGARHLVGNLVFGVFFGLFAGRLLGSGVAWLAIVVAAAVGNAQIDVRRGQSLFRLRQCFQQRDALVIVLLLQVCQRLVEQLFHAVIDSDRLTAAVRFLP